jgi:hypothetical protein
MLARPTNSAGLIMFQSWKTSQAATPAGITTHKRTPRMKGLIKMYPATVFRPFGVLNQWTILLKRDPLFEAEECDRSTVELINTSFVE